MHKHVVSDDRSVFSGDNAFKITVDGAIKFVAERERIGDRFWFWLLFRADEHGNKIGDQIDRDQYSNDIIERIKMGRYDK